MSARSLFLASVLRRPRGQSRTKIDLARANSYLARDDEALAQLLDAEAAAPQIVRHSAAVRATVKSLHRRARHAAGKSSPLVGLAERCRAIQ